MSPARACRHAAARVFLAFFALALVAGCSTHVPVQARPVTTSTTAAGVVAFDHGAFDAILARFVDAHGMVDYRGLKAERHVLDEYVGQLASASPRSHPALFPTSADRMAYWINAYNALILRAVIDHYPVASVTDIMVAHGVFRRMYFPVGGVDMTLDDIEKGVLLREFDDPRVHFALTCASMTCPRLDRTAFHAEGLDARLDQEGRDFLNSPDGVRLAPDERRIGLSMYFEWYAGDFGKDHVAFVERYQTSARRQVLAGLRGAAVYHFDYDWRLNDQAATWAAGR